MSFEYSNSYSNILCSNCSLHSFKLNVSFYRVHRWLRIWIFLIKKFQVRFFQFRSVLIFQFMFYISDTKTIYYELFTTNYLLQTIYYKLFYQAQKWCCERGLLSDALADAYLIAAGIIKMYCCFVILFVLLSYYIVIIFCFVAILLSICFIFMFLQVLLRNPQHHLLRLRLNLH